MWTLADSFALLVLNFGLIGIGICISFIIKRKIPDCREITLGNLPVLWTTGFLLSTVMIATAGTLELLSFTSWGILSFGIFVIVWTLLKHNWKQRKRTLSFPPWFRLSVGLITILAGAYILTMNYSHLSLTQPIHGVSGMGNWAYKAKLIYNSQGINAEYFTTHADHYGKFSYPPGHPLLSNLLCSVYGEYNEMLLKKQSIVMMLSLFCILSCQLIKNWSWYGIIPILGLSGLFLGNGAWTVTYWFYSEPLLWICCVSAILSLQQKHLRMAIFCGASAAWVKNEGALFFACLFFTIFILNHKKWKSILSMSVLAFLPVLLWKVIVAHYGIMDSDFSFHQFSYRNVEIAFNEVTRIAIDEWFHYSGMFLVLPIAISWFYLQKNWTAVFLSLIATFLTIIYIYSMAWSAVSDIHWHLSSATRYIMLPSFIIATILATTRFQLKTSNEISH